MMSDTTTTQLAALALSGRPLVICDVDEVMLHFTRDLEAFLGAREFYLEPASFALTGNVRRIDTSEPLEGRHVAALIDLFFTERTLHMRQIDGAIQALLDIGEQADVVMLTNLPHEAGDDRRSNLAKHGLPYPVITNSGAKGPAIRILASMTGGPAVFIDDSPSFIASAYEHAPSVHLIHFLHDQRFARHAEPMNFVSLRTATWNEAKPHVLKLIG